MSFAELASDIAAEYRPPSIGRPSIIGCEEVVTEFLQAIEAGNYLTVACDLAGLSEITVSNWIKRGTAGESPFDAFLWAYKRARAKSEHEHVQNMRRAGASPAFWAASATYLERTRPDRWSKRPDDSTAPRVVVNIGQAGQIAIAVEGSSTHAACDETLINPNEYVQVPRTC